LSGARPHRIVTGTIWTSVAASLNAVPAMAASSGEWR
jgi:hypothetical protein